jgi:hypothetical protein
LFCLSRYGCQNILWKRRGTYKYKINIISDSEDSELFYYGDDEEKIVQQPRQKVIIPESDSGDVEEGGSQTVANTEPVQGLSDGLIFSDDQEDNVQTRGQDITSEDNPQVQAVANGAKANLE